MANKENETFLQAKTRRKKGARGKAPEDKVAKALTSIKASDRNFDFDRFLDARAAGRIVTATVADFNFCYKGQAGVLEVKSTKHDFRLGYGAFPQYPRILRRVDAGGLGLLLVYHSGIKLWRMVNVADLPYIKSKSWDLTEFPTFTGKLETLIMETLEG